MDQLYSKVLGQGKPLLILHGFLGMSDNWKTLGQRYAAAGWEVHLLDQRNHGRSFWSDHFNFNLMAEDIRRYMDDKQVASATVIGHSMGGKTAMTLAAAFPSRVRKLVVADIGPKAYPPHHHTILNALNGLTTEDLKSRTAADEALARKIPEWGVRQFLLKNLYWVQPGNLGFRFNLPILSQSMEAIGEALPDTAHFAGPACFIRGGASDYIKEEDMSLIRNHFPNAKLETIAGAGHWLHAEKPDLFFEISSDFMEF